MRSIIKQNCLNYGVSWGGVKRSWDLLNWLFLFTFAFLSIEARLLRPSVSLTNVILFGGGLRQSKFDIVGTRLFPGSEQSGSGLLVCESLLLQLLTTKSLE